jgi:carbonic anhydrase
LTVTANAQEFGYSDTNGPEDWCGISTNYQLCCDGKQQSPINIIPLTAKYDAALPALKFAFPQPVTLTVVNNGHSVQANVPAGGGTLDQSSTVFNLQQFHFHTRSEHALNGFHAPIEMHLVHKDATGATAVVGVFIVAGAANEELQKIWSNLPDTENEQITVNTFDLGKLLPTALTSYRYQGSLTTPPCTEQVSWTLLSTPITMSPQQIAQFTKLFSGAEFPQGNARPVQPIEGRVVSTDVGP